MRHIEWSAGRPEVREVPDPVPAEGELLVEITRVGVTLPVVRGDADGVRGGDVVGRVLAGDAEPGSRVVSIAAADAYAERTPVPTSFAVPVPDDIGDDDAVALVRGGQVALGALRAAGTGPGDAVLVTAAAGGVGHLAVQLARVLGASRVVAAVGPSSFSERADVLTGLGASEVRTYDDLGGCKPVDVVVDGAGGPVLERVLPVLGPDGRLVVTNAVGGPVETNELRARGQSVIGFAMARMVARHPDRYAEHRERLWDEVRAGRLRPVVQGPFGFDDVAAAFALLAQRRNVGRVVLSP